MTLLSWHVFTHLTVYPSQHPFPSPPSPSAELPQPPTPGVRKSLEAHKILVTAKSLRSLDSSQTCTTEGVPAAAGGGSSARQAADTAALKCLLLEALLAAMPVVGSAGELGSGLPVW